MIKDYYLTIQYHADMANVVADAHSRTGVSMICMSLIVDLDHMGISIYYAGVAREKTQLLIQSPFARAGVSVFTAKPAQGYP